MNGSIFEVFCPKPSTSITLNSVTAFGSHLENLCFKHAPLIDSSRCRYALTFVRPPLREKDCDFCVKMVEF